MNIRINDILNLSTFKEAEVLAGKKYTDHVVKWVYLAETFPYIHDVFDWLSGDELLFIIGHCIKNGKYTFDDLIQLAKAKQVSGIVVYMGEYIKEIDESVIALCEKAQVPLITLPWHVRYVDASREISSIITQMEAKEKTSFDLLDSILFSETISYDHLKKRSLTFNIDLETSNRVTIVDIDHFHDYLESNGIHDEYTIVKIKDTLYNAVKMAMMHIHPYSVHLLKSDSVITLVNAEAMSPVNIQLFYEQISRAISSSYPNMTLSLGIGSACDDPELLKNSYHQATQVIELQAAKLIEKSTFVYDDIHIYKLLFAIKDAKFVKSHFPYLLKPVIEYDKINGSQLLDTLDVYLNSGKSLNTASKTLFVHKNTVKYRIDKIKSITHLDLSDMELCFQIMLEIRLFRFYQIGHN